MINTAADYAFVDFAAGDLPTGQFNGNIMPLRDASASEDLLKAEDVAFLIECVRDKMDAHSGLNFPSYDEYDPNGFTPAGPFYPGDGKVVPTKVILGSQMRSIRTTATTAISRGFPGNGYGFLSYALQEITNVGAWQGGANLIGQAHAVISQRFGGTWAATSTTADFASGAPVSRVPVRAIFEDAKNLVRPVFTTQFYEPFASSSHFDLTAVSGSVPAGDTGFFGWRVRHPTSNPSDAYAIRGNFKVTAVAECSRAFLSSTKVWLLYVASNRVEVDNSGSPSATTEWKSGLVDMSSYLTAGSTAGEFNWMITPTGGYALLNRIVSDCGWTMHGVSDALTQDLYPLWSCELIFEGTPNGRTKWW